MNARLVVDDPWETCPTCIKRESGSAWLVCSQCGKHQDHIATDYGALGRVLRSSLVLPADRLTVPCAHCGGSGRISDGLGGGPNKVCNSKCGGSGRLTPEPGWQGTADLYERPERGPVSPYLDWDSTPVPLGVSADVRVEGDEVIATNPRETT